MPLVATKYFGNMDYVEESVFEFPFGLPAFEHERRFVFIEVPDYAPLVFLQSTTTPNLCFLALPIQTVDRSYEFAVLSEDLKVLELNPERQPHPGDQTLTLVLVSLHDGFSATANLMAPIVVNLATRHAVQAIRPDSRYSHQYPVLALNSTSTSEGTC